MPDRKKQETYSTEFVEFMQAYVTTGQLDRRFEDNSKLTNQRFDDTNQRFADQDKAVQAALAAAKEAVQSALVSSEKAVDKAEGNSEKWRDAANEWRGAMNDRSREFLPRREFYVMIGTLIALVTLLLVFIGTALPRVTSAPPGENLGNTQKATK